MQPRIPRGLRDILPTEGGERRALATRCRDVFELWGYGEIVTPAFEFADVLATETGETISREMFRFVDSDGRLVALRPEMTTPIARAVAQRMSGEPAPHRLYYIQNVFRDEPAQRGQQREFWQAGIELLGARGPAADAEVVAIAAEALQAAGLRDFQLGVGHVGLLRAVLEGSGMGAQERVQAERLATARNLVGLDEVVAKVSPRAREQVMTLVGTRGGGETIDAARAMAPPGPGQDAIDELAETYRLLEAYGLAEQVTLDFGIIRDFDYYTGLVIEAYAAGMGFPIGAGGRYDGLLAEFGAPMAAAGVAIGLERLHIAIAEQGELVVGARRGVQVAWEGDPADALAAAREVRAAGVAAAVRLEAGSPDELEVQVHEREQTVVFARRDGSFVVMDPVQGTTACADIEAVRTELLK